MASSLLNLDKRKYYSTTENKNEPKIPLKRKKLVTFKNIFEKEGKIKFSFFLIGLMGRNEIFKMG
tara:strand:- start:506 stop:700 length:195 start_codon:yes stop_codon:yes gene_type:complete